MKHVWIVSHYASHPHEKGGLTRHYSLARHLEKHGWKATIIAASTRHPDGSQRFISHHKYKIEAIDGVRFLWLKTPTYNGNGIDRIRNMLNFSWKSLWLSGVNEIEKPDVIIGSSPHPGAACSAAILSWRLKVPFLCEVRDLWPQALIDMGRLSDRSFTAYFMKHIERRLYNHSKRIITLWPYVNKYIDEIGLDGRKAVWISNGVEMADYPAPVLPSKSNEFSLMYLGSHGGANALENVIYAMELVQRNHAASHIKLRMIGEGPDKPRLMQLAQNLKLTNVTFEDAVEKFMVPSIAAEADAFLFNLIDAPMFRYGISPNKLFDYMAAARPVIFSCNGSNNLVEEVKCGLSVPPADPVKLSEAIMTMSQLTLDDRRKMGLNAHSLMLKQYDYPILAKKMADLLDEVITL
ncbi:glycosyltransferase family 4 protein [Brucellaceae bacterium C25G]